MGSDGFRGRLPFSWVITLVSAVWIVAATAVFSQTAVFNSIRIDGTQRIEDSTVISYLGFQPGDEVTAGQVNAGLQNLIASGLFETASITPRGSTLIVEVVERPTISRINIEGNTLVEDDEIVGFLASRPRQTFIPDVAAEDARLISDIYQQRGRINARVEPRIIRRENNRVDLVFEVTEGAVVEIERISFVGNTQFSDSRLRRVLASKQAGLLRTFVGADTFIAERIDFDRQLLSDFYMSRGFVDFAVLDVASEFSRERNATFLTFTVREGQKFSFGEVTLSSALPEIDVEAFQRDIRARSGRTYSPLDVQETVDRIEQRALNLKLDFVEVTPVVTRNPSDLTIDVEFQIVRGPRIFVERIDITGNTTTLDRVIRQQFRIVEGDPFNPREIERTRNRIEALNFFATTNVTTRPGTARDQVIVDVEVEEQPTGSLSLGGSFSIDSGLGLAIGFSERNFLGRGQTLEFDLNFGTQDVNSGLRFVEPYFLGRQLAFDFDIFYRETSFDNTFFDTRSIGFSTGLRFPLSETASIRTYYKLSDDEISNVSADSSPILVAEEGARTTSALGYGFVWDTRRSGIAPDRGLRFELQQEFAGLGGDNTYVRTFARFSANRGILNEEASIRFLAEGGAVNYFDGVSRYTDRFATSANRLRGFESRGVGPRDLDAVNQDILGGNFYSLVSAEVRFPLGLPEEYGILGGVFVNAGSVWGLDNTEGAGFPPDTVDDSFELRSAAGISLFWNTPIGPIRFDFSRPIQKNPNDVEQNFNFTIATEF